MTIEATRTTTNSHKSEFSCIVISKSIMYDLFSSWFVLDRASSTTALLVVVGFRLAALASGARATKEIIICRCYR